MKHNRIELRETKKIAASILIVLATICSTSFIPSSATNLPNVSLSMRERDEVRLVVFSGFVGLSPSTDGRVHVTASRVDGTDTRPVHVRSFTSTGKVTICPTSSEAASTCELSEIRDAGTLRINMAVPRGVAVSVSVFNGNLTTDVMTNEVSASVGNGDAVLQSIHLIRAETKNGNIEATLAEAPASSALHITCGNGSILLHVPRNVAATLVGSSGSGVVRAPKDWHARSGRDAETFSSAGAGASAFEILARVTNGDIIVDYGKTQI